MLSFRETNALAARFMKRGDYDKAQATAAIAQAIAKFSTELEDLRARWSALGGASGSSAGADKRRKLPVWVLYRPILQTLADLGGEARGSDIEEYLSATRPDYLSAIEDFDVGPHWKRVLRRARRPMIEEGYLEGIGKRWRITAEGRRVVDTGHLSGEPARDQE
jgi:hypothetical protein